MQLPHARLAAALLAPPSLPALPRVTSVAMVLGLPALLLIGLVDDLASAHPVNPPAVDLALVAIFGALPASWLVGVATLLPAGRLAPTLLRLAARTG